MSYKMEAPYGAIMSKDHKYRYLLWRKWDQDGDFVMFIMFNPSTADDSKDDPTIKKCIAYAKAWGYGGIAVVNLFAYRSKHPDIIAHVEDPVGPFCDYWIKRVAPYCKVKIAAWGNMNSSDARKDKVRILAGKLHCLELSKSGQPKHPLYLRKNLKPIIYK